MLPSRALDAMKEEGTNYNEEIRNHFNKFNKVLHKHQPCSYLSDESRSPEFDEHRLKASTYEKQRNHLGLTEKHRRYQFEHAKSGGGDADRPLYDIAPTSACGGDSGRCNHDQYLALRHLHGNGKMQMAAKSIAGMGSYQQTNTQKPSLFDECMGDHRLLCETLSHVGDLCTASEGGSSKSQKSSKTVVSRKSSHELKKLVKSKCKLQEEVDEAIQQLCNVEDLDKTQKDVQMLYDKAGMQLDMLTPIHCKHCTEKSHHSQLSQKDVTTEIEKTDFANGNNEEALTISADDVVSSKVINPMIRKLQRMYLNNLKEEMSLMEDLERLPNKVREVYQAKMFKE